MKLNPEFCSLPCRVLMNKMPPRTEANENLVKLTNRLLNIDYKAVIVYEDNDPIGLITLKDIMRWLVKSNDKESIIAKDLISVPLICVDIDDPLQKALDLMDKYSINYLGVKEENKLKGLLHEDGVKEICENYPHYLRMYK
ncbi:CBS domain-containing protein [Candidatus Bathyarchaeota archaeon]|nr:CBS domain-containing protein [Candidatus Bathyarchaeota archaeon]